MTSFLTSSFFHFWNWMTFPQKALKPEDFKDCPLPQDQFKLGMVFKASLTLISISCLIYANIHFVLHAEPYRLILPSKHVLPHFLPFSPSPTWTWSYLPLVTSAALVHVGTAASSPLSSFSLPRRRGSVWRMVLYCCGIFHIFYN